MIVQLIATDNERKKASKMLKSICMIEPHTDVLYFQNGNMHMYAISTDSKKGG